MFFRMEKDTSGDLFDMVFKGKVAVRNGSEVEVMWERRQTRVINGETEVVNGFGGGLGTYP